MTVNVQVVGLDWLDRRWDWDLMLFELFDDGGLFWGLG
jgi:hypothetical protein